MPNSDQVRRLHGQGCDYPEIARRLGVPAGQAYLIGTGLPADGSDSTTEEERRREGVLPSAQHLLGVPVETPTGKESVLRWIGSRVADDAQMRAAHAARRRGRPEGDRSEGDQPDDDRPEGADEEGVGGRTGLV